MTAPIEEHANKLPREHNLPIAMFQRITKFFREVRIKADFPRYEANKQHAHIVEAERRFDTRQLETETRSIADQCLKAANEKFGLETSALQYEIATIESQIKSKQQTLAIFERDYKSELNELHDRKNALLDDKAPLINEMKVLQAERSSTQESLQDAYSRLESAKDSIDSWYSKSDRTPWLFGNGGKKLPKHSIFVQSFGDLDGYKRDRGAAVSDIGDCKNEISSIKSRQSANKRRRDENKEALARVFEQIDATKAVRQQMFDLKQQGVTPPLLKKDLSDLSTYLSNRSSLLTQLQNERRTFIAQREGQMGIWERKAAIEAIKARKAQFLDDFHTPFNHEARRTAHREQWLSEHGVRPNQ